jgi:hypothetical protein
MSAKSGVLEYDVHKTNVDLSKTDRVVYYLFFSQQGFRICGGHMGDHGTQGGVSYYHYISKKNHVYVQCEDYTVSQC